MPHELIHEGYLISDDPARLDVDAVHAYLTRSYWAGGIPRDLVERSMRNSLCIGIYRPSGEQVGLTRIISDYATFAWLCDVYVLESHRGRGLSKAALRAVQSHPQLQNLRNISLGTRDAHGLYAQFGFKPLANPETRMENAPSPVVVPFNRKGSPRRLELRNSQSGRQTGPATRDQETANELRNSRYGEPFRSNGATTPSPG